MRIDPELRQRLNPWDWLVLVVAVVSLLLVILETFLHVPPSVLSLLRTVDMMSCGIFLADVFVRWRRENFSAGFWRWAWLDVLASIPFEPAFRSLQAIRIYPVHPFVPHPEETQHPDDRHLAQRRSSSPCQGSPWSWCSSARC
jgi:hypothetical protein